jgi:hypothetical protein
MLQAHKKLPDPEKKSNESATLTARARAREIKRSILLLKDFPGKAGPRDADRRPDRQDAQTGDHAAFSMNENRGVARSEKI